MTVKHQPATPLPWKLSERPALDGSWISIDRTDGFSGSPVHSIDLAHYRVSDDPLPEGARHITPDDIRGDYAYIAHAANAYPKLVAALRASLGCTVSASIAAERLLGEIGELEPAPREPEDPEAEAARTEARRRATVRGIE